jgi:hypothetical protein
MLAQNILNWTITLSERKWQTSSSMSNSFVLLINWATSSLKVYLKLGFNCYETSSIFFKHVSLEGAVEVTVEDQMDDSGTNQNGEELAQ